MRLDVLERAARLHTALICDVLDKLGQRFRAMAPTVRPLVPGMQVVGWALPLAVAPWPEAGGDPYEGLFRAFRVMQPGEVPVIGVGDAPPAGQWGELLSIAARARGARGAVTDGQTRDVDQIVAEGFPVFAAGASPLDCDGRSRVVSVGEPTFCGGVRVARGDLVVGDVMGVAVIPAALVDEVLALAEAKDRGESTVRDALRRGDDLEAVFRQYGIL